VLINGDDILFTADNQFIDIWKSCLDDAGFIPSPGKNMVSNEYAMVNSQLYQLKGIHSNRFSVTDYRPSIKKIGFVNFGLLTGRKKNDSTRELVNTSIEVPIKDLKPDEDVREHFARVGSLVSNTYDLYISSGFSKFDSISKAYKPNFDGLLKGVGLTKYKESNRTPCKEFHCLIELEDIVANLDNTRSLENIELGEESVYLFKKIDENNGSILNSRDIFCYNSESMPIRYLNAKSDFCRDHLVLIEKYLQMIVKSEKINAVGLDQFSSSKLYEETLTAGKMRQAVQRENRRSPITKLKLLNELEGRKPEELLSVLQQPPISLPGFESNWPLTSLDC